MANDFKVDRFSVTLFNTSLINQIFITANTIRLNVLLFDSSGDLILSKCSNKFVEYRHKL